MVVFESFSSGYPGAAAPPPGSYSPYGQPSASLNYLLLFLTKS